MLIEQLQYNLLFRWFVGMEMDEVVWNHAVYSKNRERLLNEEIAATFFGRVLDRERGRSCRMNTSRWMER
jgi:transposase